MLDESKVTKKNYKGIATAENFVVVWAGNDYLVYSESRGASNHIEC